MTRQQQGQVNDLVIARIEHLLMGKDWIIPTYKAVVRILNAEGYRTSRNNFWTTHRLFRMLQRNQYSGLWGVKKMLKHKLKTEKGYFQTT